MAMELTDHAVTAVALTPGFLRSEAMLEHFGVSEANWRDGARKDKHFAESETPFFIGRAVAALAADPDVASKAGQALSSWSLAKEYGFRDVDGRQPDWGGYFTRTIDAIFEHGGPREAAERLLLQMRYYQVHLDPEKTEEKRRIERLLAPPGTPP